MAEAVARSLATDRVEASSAGLFPAAIVQPETFQVMAERGMPIDPGARPRNIVAVEGRQVDVLVNMSGAPAERLLADFGGRLVDWEIPDPIGRSLEVYRSARDLIESKVRVLLGELAG